MPSNASKPSAVLDHELRAAVAARQELGAELEPEVIAAFLARIENAVTASPSHRDDPAPRRPNFTARIAWSLLLGIPLVAVTGAVGNEISPEVGGFGIIAALLTVFGLNVYYTEVEKDLELKRMEWRRK
ncbi:MAG: hypothetical protein ACRDJ9_35325 [Dehalococcoidia bacterium]